MTDRIEFPETNPPERTGHERIEHQHQIHPARGAVCRQSGSDISVSGAGWTVTHTGRQAAHRQHSELPVVCGAGTLLDAWSSHNPNDLARRATRLVISRCLLVGFGRRVAGADFYIAIRGAQIGPIDIGPQVFAADLPASGALNGWASLGGDLPGSGFPLTDDHVGNTDGAGQIAVAAALVKVSFQVHGAQFSLGRKESQ